MDHDVLIIGGGPAGSSTALALARHAPQLSTVLVEASVYEQPRIGEVLPALARGLLEHLDVWKGFQDQGHPQAHSTLSVWGNAAPRTDDLIFSPYGSGWHLDRKRFDSFLASQASQNGTRVLSGTRVRSFESVKNGWQVKTSDGREINARFVVDATGRRAFFAQRMGADLRAFDRLMSFSRLFTLDARPSTVTAIEAFEHGWWYTARAGDARIVSCLTDADIAKRLDLNVEQQWTSLLTQTSQIRNVTGRGQATEVFMARPANSVLSSKVCGQNWLAAGEAASAFDPLSSQGIIKSLRSGIFASYAIADALLRSNTQAMPRYEHFIKTEFATYLNLYKKNYTTETRWPASTFWQRRHDLSKTQALKTFARE